MSNENQTEPYRQHRTAQDKYIYFMLAAAGACIAFAVTKTQDSALGWKHTVLAVAVLSWAVSFYAGVMHLRYVSASLIANLELLRVEAGEHPEVGTHVKMRMAASQGIRETLSESSNRGSFWSALQFRPFILGSCSYLAWHVLEMYLRIKP